MVGVAPLGATSVEVFAQPNDAADGANDADAAAQARSERVSQENSRARMPPNTIERAGST